MKSPLTQKAAPALKEIADSRWPGVEVQGGTLQYVQGYKYSQGPQWR